MQGKQAICPICGKPVGKKIPRAKVYHMACLEARMKADREKMDPNETLQQINQGLVAGNKVTAKKDCRVLAQWMCDGGSNPVWSKYPRATAYWSELSFDGEFDDITPEKKQ